MLSRTLARLQSRAVPELPDLAILADAIDTALTGRPMTGATTPQTLVVRGTPTEFAAFNGQTVNQVFRRGKFLIFELTRDRIIVNPMLTGRFGFAVPGVKPWPQLAASMSFGVPVQAAKRTLPMPDWPGQADWLPGRDSAMELRYRDATRMGKIYLLPEGVERPVAGWDNQGPDADDPALTLDVWRSRIARYSGELKNLLRNQEFVAGIGNAYSDEILWAARLAPFRKRASLAAAEIDELYTAMRETLAWAITQLRLLVPPRLEVEQRKFLNVHMKGGEACPRCGSRISEVKAGGFVTNYCRTCQR
jgi:formamidopyrimidine-DNA glycosylase